LKVKLLAATTARSACWADLPPPEINIISGLAAKEAQKQVWEFSSRKYTSH